jgi:IgGFc binding protein
MTLWLRCLFLAGVGGAVAVGCGSGGSGFVVGGESGSSSGGSGSSSGAGHDSGGGSGSSSGGLDATTGNDGASSGGPTDATLDVGFPDSFFSPDASDGASSSSDAGSDVASCTPDGVTCNGNVENKCSSGVLTTTDCATLPTPETCSNGYGCVVCQPGTGSCTGTTGTACNADGSGYTTSTCDPQLGEGCNTTTGACTGDCAVLGTSYIGCEYYAVSMSNTQLDQTSFDYSVSISNTTANAAAIVITGPNAFSQTYSLAGGAIQNYILPWVSTLSKVNTTTLVAGGAYHIKSTEPITVYQFNAYEYEVNKACASDPNPSPPCRSYTNDASLLIPVNALTGNYFVVSGADWHSLGFTSTGGSCSTSSGSSQLPGMAVIVGTQAGTTVTIGATGAILPGQGLTATGGTVTLGQGDVLQVSTAENATTQCTYGSDISGSTIKASAPVLVLGGSDCTFTPQGTGACDHLEQINFPLETLGTDYLVTLPYNKNGTPRQYVKVVGTAAGTTLTTSPVQAGVPATIGAGQVVWFEATLDFHLTASAPVAVGQFMEGQDAFGASCALPNLEAPPDCGDPSMSMAVATNQFRTSYQFIAPPSYYENWVSIIAPTGSTVTVDGTAVTGFTAIGTSQFSVAHVSLCAAGGTCTGVHTAASSSDFGVQVYGYGYFTSYMYPGGLNLARQ